ncbi:trehalose-phosphatase [Agrilutibacter solisilvae]|uniref:Trehalose 6-phosphate phosphatase n=1 Tax=Agrilutibacter solisilvae TaxID=2763317 RepID=A0A974XZ94_9GAMM|nr:trehalose-phosphatase [Lysobacter solisilvae]QSX78527.1 trehalose-phosphatase [Lysobacter solisilvae]
MSADPDRLPPPPSPARDWALLLDVDGTLLEFAPHPDGVRVPDGLVDDLARLHAALGGALGLVSGRRLETLDALFAPLVLPAIGLHGLQRRDAGVSVHAAPHEWAVVCAGALALCAKFPGALVEDKGLTLALHWRNAPAAEEPLREFAHSALIQLPGYQLQPGHDVVELRPDGHDKGDGILAMLQSPAFQGRLPVFVGDDLTDEHGFDAVNLRHGLSVRVGHREPTAAMYGLRDPAHVRRWLAQAAMLLGPDTPTRPTTPQPGPREATADELAVGATRETIR